MQRGKKREGESGFSLWKQSRPVEWAEWRKVRAEWRKVNGKVKKELRVHLRSCKLHFWSTGLGCQWMVRLCKLFACGLLLLLLWSLEFGHDDWWTRVIQVNMLLCPPQLARKIVAVTRDSTLVKVRWAAVNSPPCRTCRRRSGQLTLCTRKHYWFYRESEADSFPPTSRRQGQVTSEKRSGEKSTREKNESEKTPSESRKKTCFSFPIVCATRTLTCTQVPQTRNSLLTLSPATTFSIQKQPKYRQLRHPCPASDI